MARPRLKPTRSAQASRPPGSLRPRPATQQTYTQNILRVLQFLQDNLDTPLTLEQLASTANFSPCHFHRIFAAQVGETVMEHIRRLRLERAALKLALENEQVITLAFEAGYETHESFTRAFAGHFGMSPIAYRRAYRGKHKLQFRAPAPRHARAADAAAVDAARPDALPDVRIEKHPTRHAIFSRHFGAYFEVGPAWTRVFGFAQRHGLLSPRTLMIGISHDSPDITPEERIRYDACITVDKPPQPEGEIGVLRIPGGTRAVLTHRGPYDGLKRAYDQLFRLWLPQSGCALVNAPDYEIYLNNPSDTPPEKLLTEICLPVSTTTATNKHTPKK